MQEIVAEKLTVLLRSTGSAKYAGHMVTGTFTQRVLTGKDTHTNISRTVSAPVDANATASLLFPENLLPEAEVKVGVLAPDGEVLAEEVVSYDFIRSEKPLVIEVNPKDYFPIVENESPSFGKPTRLRGLVVDLTGKRCVGNRHVVISAQPVAPDAVYKVVAAARTDAGGHFWTTYPLESFAAAGGRVDGGPPIPIQLDIDGFLPERVILAIELPDDSVENDGSHCCGTDTVPHDPDDIDLASPGIFADDIGGGRCVDFTKPNRVLEEFDHYMVVRTTEPQINGLTLTPPPKVGLDSLIHILNPQILSYVLESQSVSDLFSTGKAAGLSFDTSPAAAGTARAAAADRTAGSQPVDLNDAKSLASVALASARPELEHLSEAVGLASLKVAYAQTGDDGPKINLSAVHLDAQIVKALASDPDGFSLAGLAKAELISRKNDLVQLLDLIKRPSGGRERLTCENAIDWDDEPTIYQACTIAHAHLLRFKQQWMADGYSLGDLLHSLPLAPCQKKQIAVIDWDRRESASRRESLEEEEALSSYLSRDRDISEIAQASVIESMLGGSKSTTTSIAGGTGGSFVYGAWAAVAGMGGGASGASSSAWQLSARSAAATSMQQLRDFTQQAASAMRSQRATVVQTVRQGETMRVQTEVIANHNHCHAITVELFEVQRHFLVRHRLADVQECLLVPLLMARFDSAKARRWEEGLRRYLRKPRLAPGFDALQRIADNYVGSDMPTGAYAEESLVYLDGYLRIQFRIQRPIDNDDGSYLAAAWEPMAWLGITSQEWWQNYLEQQQERDRVFAEMLGPRIAEDIVQGLRIYAVDENDNETLLPTDLTLVSDFGNDTPLYASLRLSDALPPIRRDEIKFIKIDTTVDTAGGPQAVDAMLATGSKIVIHSGQMGYRTDHIAHDLFRQSRILNDLSGTDGVLIYTPLSREELRRPREEDKEVANSLLKHLNDNMEHYHRVIWWHMDSQRRYMLLDGFVAPNSGGRSVASVVENRLIGILGNCLVMPVARGFHLDPTFQQDLDHPIDLLEHYQPTTPVAPLRIALPTKGVFAEAVMGACNSCEKKDESRFWRWEESPCPDEPTPIQAVSTESRRAEPPDLTPQPFPQPIVAFQNVPAAPDPQGLAGILQTISNPNLFRDVTGLTETQRNALAALQSAFDTAKFFGDKAADLNLQGAMRQDVDKALDKINDAYQSGAINAEQRSQLTESALRGMVGGGAQAPAQPMTVDQMEQLTETAGANDAVLTHTVPGEAFTVDAKPPEGMSYGPSPVLILFGPSGNSPDARAFFPSDPTQAKLGEITIDALVSRSSAGATRQWTTISSGTKSGRFGEIVIVSPNQLSTKVRAHLPGLTDLTLTVTDQGVTSHATVELSVPQFVTIDEDTAQFDPFLTAVGLNTVKDDVIIEARSSCEFALAGANVRLIWRINPFSEAPPSFISSSSLTTVTIRGEPKPSDPQALGNTNRPSTKPVSPGPEYPREIIDIFPGGLDNNLSYKNSEEITKLAAVVASSGMTPALQGTAVKMVGRTIGHLIAHEVLHAMVGSWIPRVWQGHNQVPIFETIGTLRVGDLLNAADQLSLTDSTGFERVKALPDFDSSYFMDHQIQSMSRLLTQNQAVMDVLFPVPTAFK